MIEWAEQMRTESGEVAEFALNLCGEEYALRAALVSYAASVALRACLDAEQRAVFDRMSALIVSDIEAK
jgi:hypothetical protein